MEPQEEAKDIAEERPEVNEEWKKQYEERRKINRSAKLGLTKSYHICGDGCNHAALPSTPNLKTAKTPTGSPKPKSWFQRYAEVNLVERDAPGHEVNAVPKVNEDTDYEIITVTVDSGAYNTVGPPTVGTHFKLSPTEA